MQVSGVSYALLGVPISSSAGRRRPSWLAA